MSDTYRREPDDTADVAAELERQDREYWDAVDRAGAEIKGRTTRTTSFKIREARPNEVMNDDPRRYMLEIKFGNHAHLFALSEADIKNGLKFVVDQFAHGSCPIQSVI